MAAPSPARVPGTPLDPLVARRTHRTVEPLHAMIYFAPEATAAYAALGLPERAGYFASRAAPMGPVGPEVVTATFFNFHPALVRAAIPAAWEAAPPEAVSAARLEAAGAALGRLLGDGIGSPEMARAADLARRAALRAAELPEGRPLFAAHAGLGWPDAPHLVLWHAQALLREFRGDGHIAALVLAELDAVGALALHVATGELPEAFLKGVRGWPDEQWDAGVERLVARGLVVPVTPTEEHPARLAMTAEGARFREGIEERTDRAAEPAYRAIGEDGCAELRSLARPFSRAVLAGGGLGA